METARDETPEEGEEPKPIDEIVGGVLSEYSSGKYGYSFSWKPTDQH